jgi:hypothetical protein
MRTYEREPKFLIDGGYLERIEDFELDGRTVRASRLGYRITTAFVDRFLGRIFEMPDRVFTDEILCPELQDRVVFAAGVDAICEAQRRVALNYFEDGSSDAACPPVKVLLHVMAYGHYEGQSIADPALRAMFTREAVLASDWYQARLVAKQARDVALWTRHVAATGSAFARDRLAWVRSPKYLQSLHGTIGADPVDM